MRLGLKREHRFHFWHRSLKRYRKDLHNAPFWAPFGHPGRPNAAFGPFWGQPKKTCFFLKGPDARFGSNIDPKWGLRKIIFWPLFGTFFQRVPPSVKSTLKVTFFIKQHNSFPMCFALYAGCSRRYTHEKHIKNTVFRQCSQWLAESNRYPAGQVHGQNHFQLVLLIRIFRV